MPGEVVAEKPVDLEKPSAAGSGVAIAVRNLGKCFRLYSRPQERLKQALFRWKRCYFREFWAVRKVSLEVRRGETVGIMGRNGCGKSTLLQMICNTLTPTTGHVEINGRIGALLELGAGFNPEFTGRDNIYTSGAVLGLSRAELDARYDDIVAFAELGDFIDRPVKIYSSGMYVRLAFAVASSIEPDILVVDEALAVGDEAFQRKCFARIEAIKKRGGTILFVSHAATLVTELCDRAVLLERGERLLTGKPKTVVKMYQKLLYAKPANLPSVRAEILRLDQESEPAPDTPGTPGPSLPPAGKPPVESKNGTERAYYQRNMKPKSTLVYDVNGAEIINPLITTLDGRRVNVLVPHQQYVIKYRVRFTKPAYHVVWGTLLKNIRGIEISGMAKPQFGKEYVPAGSEAHVAFRFRCSLMPGVYFANVGVYGVIDGRERFLHRMVDALMFCVLHENNHTSHGIMDCFVNSEITLQDIGSAGAHLNKSRALETGDVCSLAE